MPAGIWGSSCRRSRARSRGSATDPKAAAIAVYHFSPILYLCAPLLWLAHSPLALIAIQAVACALVAPAVYVLLRERAPELAVPAAIVALLYPPLVGVAFTDFHEDGFAPAALVWLAWALDRRRWTLAAALVVVALSIKEDEAYILAVSGVGLALWAWRRRDRALLRFCVLTVLAALATSALFFEVVRPLAGARTPWVALQYFGAANAQPTALDEVLGRVGYLLEAFVPLCFVPAFSASVAFVVPGLFEDLVSRWSITYTMGQHYAGVWIGQMLYAFALGLARIARDHGPGRARALALACLGLSLVNLTVASPTHWGHFLGPIDAHVRALDRAVAAIPPGASVGSHDEVYSHLGFDPAANAGFDGRPEYLIVDRHYYRPDQWAGPVGRHIEDVIRTGGYAVVSSDDGVIVYRRSAAAAARAFQYSQARGT